jgi:hypothetical protein
MNSYEEAISTLNSLPLGWEWGLTKYSQWYHCVISNDGLKHEPVYTQDANCDRTDLLKVVRSAYEAYRAGEQREAA